MKNFRQILPIIRNHHGFTLIELIVVITMMAIVSAVIISAMATRGNELVADLEALKAHLRYAQSRAMSTESGWYVKFEAGPAPGRYALYQYWDKMGKEIAKTFPGEGSTSLPLSKGISLVGGAPIVFFDRLGRPFTDQTGTTAQSGVRTIVTSAAGNIEIKPETGFIP